MTTETLTSTDLIAGTWSIDPSHSEVGFTVRHLMTKVRGQFEKFEGKISTGASLAETAAKATIDLNSVNTRDEQRDGHLRSGDFFDTENHGQMTFSSTSFDGSTAKGDLTIKGITRPVELDVEFLGIEKDAYGLTRIGFEATTEISRNAYGIDWNAPLGGDKVLVGDKVAITLSIQAVLDQA